MAIISTDLIPGVAVSGMTTITAQQLQDLVGVATPQADKGLVVTTTDTAGVPLVPPYARWGMYIWRRITSTGIIIYSWDPFRASDPTLLQWAPINTTTSSVVIAPGSITNTMLGLAIIDNSNVVPNSIDFYNLANYADCVLVGTAVGGGTALGGILAGTMPNPTFNNSATNAIPLTALTVPGGNINKILQVNSSGVVDFASPANVLQKKVAQVTATASAVTTGVTTTITPTGGAPITGASINITPKSSSSILEVELVGLFSGTNAAAAAFFVLVQDATTVLNTCYAGSNNMVAYTGTLKGYATPVANVATTITARLGSTSSSYPARFGESPATVVGKGWLTVTELITA